MHELGEKYLPRFPLEDLQYCQARLNSTPFYNAYRRTVRGLSGMVFRKDVVLADDVPQPVHDDADDIDLAGRSLATFSRDVFVDEMIDGHSDILVEFPRVMEGQLRSARDEEQAGLRPYWSSITKGRVIRFEHDISSGRPVLTRYAFRDSRWERAGPFAHEKIEQIHEYTKLGNIVML